MSFLFLYNEDEERRKTLDGVPSAQISVSSLTNRSRSKSSMKINASALKKFQTNLNSHAKLRDFLVTFIKNLSINDAMSLNLQASALTQLTESTDQLTRDASVKSFFPKTKFFDFRFSF